MWARIRCASQGRRIRALLHHSRQLRKRLDVLPCEDGQHTVPAGHAAGCGRKPCCYQVAPGWIATTTLAELLPNPRSGTAAAAHPRRRLTHSCAACPKPQTLNSAPVPKPQTHLLSSVPPPPTPPPSTGWTKQLGSQEWFIKAHTLRLCSASTTSSARRQCSLRPQAARAVGGVVFHMSGAPGSACQAHWEQHWQPWHPRASQPASQATNPTATAAARPADPAAAAQSQPEAPGTTGSSTLVTQAPSPPHSLAHMVHPLFLHLFVLLALPQLHVK